MITNKYLLVGAAVAGLALAYVVYRSGAKVADAVGDAAHAVNPLNNDNVINRGFTNLYQGATGSAGSLGTDIYDALHGGALDWGVFAAIETGALNPASDQNIVYGGVNSVVQAITGDDNASLGTKIYDWLH